MSVTDILALIWLPAGGLILTMWAGLTPGQAAFAGVWAVVYAILITELT